MSVFGMIFDDTANVYSEVVHQSDVDENPYDFFTKLAHEMIFNYIDRPVSRIRLGLDIHSPGYPGSTGSPGTGTSPKNSVALSPSKEKRKRVINILFQVVARSRVSA